METASIKTRNDPDFSLKSPHTKCFFIAADADADATDGINHNQYHCCSDEIAAYFQLSNIEMITFQTVAYTSLKDMLPSSPSSTMSPTNSRKDSWREIPIKDPLLQHAAWAYLQPMGEARDADNRSLMEKLKDKCCGLFACFNDVVLAIVKNCCRDGGDGRRTESEGSEEHKEEDKD